MEKISQIVRPNARMAAVDLKSSGPARAGAPGFGRGSAESRGGLSKELSTADRAALAANDLADQRRSSETRIIDQLARDFFGDKSLTGAPPVISVEAGPTPASPAPAVDAAFAPPAGYVPRGTFVDVRA